MTQSSWVQLVNNEQFNQLNSGQAYSNSVTPTDISPGANVAGQAFLLQASALYAGMQLKFLANGIASTTGSPQLTLGIYFGGIAGTPLAVATFGASANMSNNVWRVEALLRCDSTGTSATLRTLGQAHGLSSTTVMLPATSSSGGSASVASGVSNIITLGAQWGSGSVSNSITCHQWLIQQLN